MKNKKDGLYNKYFVERLDDSLSHRDCEYFVLDMTHDKYSKIALVAYALHCSDEHPQLAADLRDKISKME